MRPTTRGAALYNDIVIPLLLIALFFIIGMQVEVNADRLG